MKSLKACGCVIFLIAALGLAGTSDLTDQVIYTMPKEVYQSIKDTLSVHGKVPSDYEIARYYIKESNR